MTRHRGPGQSDAPRGAATIGELLRRGSGALSGHSDSARLDAELLLADTLNASRTHLYTWPERAVEPARVEAFERLVERRRQGVPVAQLLGRQEFFGLSLRVTGDTLVPRPETERLVELALEVLSPMASPRVLDLGTGTGAIALAIADARPDARIDAVEVSEAAAAVARRNAEELGLGNVRVLAGDWLTPVSAERYHAVVSNPPYVAESEAPLTSRETRHEPRSALFADDNGLAALKRIARETPAHLFPGGWLILEHGFRQADGVRTLLKTNGFRNVATYADLAGHERVTLGQWPEDSEEHGG